MNPDENMLAVLAGAAAIDIPAEDMDPLLAALRNHLDAVQALASVDVDDVEPIVAFDPRWT